MKTLQILVWLSFISLLFPPTAFIIHQWKYRRSNGIIKIVRNHTVYWVISYLSTLVYLIIRRGIVIAGNTFENGPLDVIALGIFTLMSVATWRYFFMYRRLIKSQTENK